MSQANEHDRERADYLAMSPEQQHRFVQAAVRRAHASRMRLIHITARRLGRWTMSVAGGALAWVWRRAAERVASTLRPRALPQQAPRRR